MTTLQSGDVLTKEKTDLIYALAEKPIEIVFEDFVEIKPLNNYEIEINKKLSGFETTYLGIWDCGDMSDEEFKRIVDKWNSIPEIYPVRHDDLVKAIEISEKNLGDKNI